MSVTRERLIRDYAAEIDHAVKLKLRGVLEVTGNDCLKRGSMPMPIDDYIRRWEDGIRKMLDLPAGSDLANTPFNY